MAKKVNETTAFTVAGLEPNRWMLCEKPNSTWAWKLVALDGGGTHLISVHERDSASADENGRRG
jgi:hypothetical protein